MKREETNDIVQYLIPSLELLDIARENMKVDVATDRSGQKRGDIWISLATHADREFENKIVALIEAKHKNATVGDMDWRDAMRHGKEKALRQRLTYYVVTNCKTQFRYYNGYNDEEIKLDGKVLTRIVELHILRKISTQVSPDNSYVVHKASKKTRPVSETKFRITLKRLADIYRSAGLKKGDERIDPTISFVVLKYIDEKEKEERVLNKVIKLWGDLNGIVTGEDLGDLRVEFEKMIHLIWHESSPYRNNIYSDFKDLTSFLPKLKSEHFKKIYKELDAFHFHGTNFDLFGAIYEEFASQTKKKEFGEFYTRRHIAGMVARLLLRNEKAPRDFKICDPACGTGGFLTEGYIALVNNYNTSGKLNRDAYRRLHNVIFWGYDNDEKSVARTKLNMFLVGDGHIHIYENDSLIGWRRGIEWGEDEFEFIMTNPPMGKYEGDARIESFEFTNERRMELLFMENVIRAAKPGGEIAIIMNDGALEAPSRENFREMLLKSANIFAVISLSKFCFAPYTKEKTYILFMQKKQDYEENDFQTTPIWHFILDYDGFANSDKRYRTKFHDDVPELEDIYGGAVDLAKTYLTHKKGFKRKRSEFERAVNEREKAEGITGLKYGYVEMSEINEDNFYNLLSEFHLRPVIFNKIPEKVFDQNVLAIADALKSLEENGMKLGGIISGND